MNTMAKILSIVCSLPARKRISMEIAPGEFRVPRDDSGQKRLAALSTALERSQQQAKLPTEGRSRGPAPFYLCSEVSEPRATAAAVHRPYSHGAIGWRSWRISGTGS